MGNINSCALEYVENLISGTNEDSKKLYHAIIELRKKDENAMYHCTSLMYSYKCPANVAFLAYDISLKQIECGKNANPQRIFQTLSRNDRSIYEKVKPLYDSALDTLNKISKEKTEQEKINEEENNKIQKMISEKKKDEEKRKDAMEFLENELMIKTFNCETHEKYVINSSIIPKTAWLIDVYATSYEDYCNIVNKTLMEFNNSGYCIFLIKPEIFKLKIEKKIKPQIAYSIVAGEKFRFEDLSDVALNELDSGEDVENMDGIKISKRSCIRFVSFSHNVYTDKYGNISRTNDMLLSEYDNEKEILKDIGSVGQNKNNIKQYIELMTGIPQNDKQLYKATLCGTSELENIASILKEIDNSNLDFIVNTNNSDTKVLFIHNSHINEFTEKIRKNNIRMEFNPAFN